MVVLSIVCWLFPWYSRDVGVLLMRSSVFCRCRCFFCYLLGLLMMSFGVGWFRSYCHVFLNTFVVAVVSWLFPWHSHDFDVLLMIAFVCCGFRSDFLISVDY